MLLPANGLPLSHVTGRMAVAENVDVLRKMMTADAHPIRSQYPKHMRQKISGSIDWENLDGPLLDYTNSRKQYGDMFQRCLDASPRSQRLLQTLRQEIINGKRVVIAETDGPDLLQRDIYIEKGVEEFTTDGLMRVTPKAWEVVSNDTSRCFGHCWHICRLLLDLPNEHPTSIRFDDMLVTDLIAEAKRTDKQFRISKKVKAKKTREKRRRNVLRF